MRAASILGLYPRRWRQRYGAEIADLLAQEPLDVRLVIDLIRGAVDAHLHPELVAPLLATAGGGTAQVPPRSPRIRGYVIAVVLLLLLVFGGLYSVRAQTPAIPSVSLSQAITEVQAGRVSAIEVAGSHATITLVDGTRRQTTVGETPDDPLSVAVIDYNRTNATNQVRLNYGSGQSVLSLIVLPLFSLLITVLPIALLALLVLLLANRLNRAARRDDQCASRYEWLARIADLRDRGVLTEEEFQREKTRLLE